MAPTRLIEPSGQPGSSPEDRSLLILAYCVIFTRYCIATFLSSFFTPVAFRLHISSGFAGVVFAAYPSGMALTSAVAPKAIRWLGTRTAVVLGLVATSALTAGQGLAPDLLTMPSMQWGMFGCYFLNGLIGALAETACLIMVCARFRHEQVRPLQSQSGPAPFPCGALCLFPRPHPPAGRQAHRRGGSGDGPLQGTSSTLRPATGSARGDVRVYSPLGEGSPLGRGGMSVLDRAGVQSGVDPPSPARSVN